MRQKIHIIKNLFQDASNLSNSRQILLFCIVISLLTMSIYWRVHNFSFISLDDGLYVTENPNIRNGLTLQSIKWAFSTEIGFWFPLTWLSHILDVELYGINAGYHHLTSVVIHLINTLLLFLIFIKMTGDFWKTVFIAGLFAIHPIHIESVAWIAERKDVLSTLFFMSTIWIYLKYLEKPKKLTYIALCFAFLLGLMSKPMIVTLPFTLILLDYWPLCRFVNAQETSKTIFSKNVVSVLIHLIFEKVPLFLLSFLVCIITYYAQHQVGTVKPMVSLSFFLRLGNAFVSYIKYIEKMVFPTNMAIFYPYYSSIPWWQVICAFSFIISATCFGIYFWKKKPWFIVGWFWYLGTLVPVIGLVQVGSQSMADRFLYIPSIGLSIVFIWSLYELKFSDVFRKTIIILILGICLTISWYQIGYWRNTETIFEHAVEVTKNNFVAHKNLGEYYYNHGFYDKAFINFRQAGEIKKNDHEVYNNIGAIFVKIGKIDDAIPNLKKAILLKPDFASAYNNLGVAYEIKGDSETAIRNYNKAIKIDPFYEVAKKNKERASKQR